VQKEWAADVYHFSKNREVGQKRDIMALAQHEFSLAKVHKLPANPWTAGQSTTGRAEANERVHRDEQLRNEWARKAFRILLISQLVPGDEASLWEQKSRYIIRLKKGLRVRTLQQRVQALERLSRWAALTLGRPWISKLEELEDYLTDLSTGKSAGVTTFDRARCAVLYLEAAAGIPEESRLGSCVTIKSTIRELVLEISQKKAVEKRQAPQHLSRILENWEKAVLSDAQPLYMRAYLWLKLVTVWGVLRGEDSTWLDPRSLSFDPLLGLNGQLLQSKTTGPAKKVRIRTMRISPKAYLVSPEWLPVGLKLWEAVDPDRQNFLVLPSKGYEGFLTVGAEQQDRAALTRLALFSAGFGLDGDEVPDQEELLGWCSRFWTEHSSRSTVVSMARALHVPKEITDRLGWWAVGDSASEEYIRTYRVLVERVQDKVASYIRMALVRSSDAKGEHSPDLFGEKLVLNELKTFLQKKIPDLDMDEASVLFDYLNVYDRAKVKTDEEEYIGWESETMKDMEWVDIQLSKESHPEPGEPTADAKELGSPEIGTWIITTPARNSNGRCLHVVGSCYRLPGFHYASWMEVAQPVPDHLFTKACHQCFPRGYPIISSSPPEVLEEELDDCMPLDAARDDLSSSSSSS
jgi:hypothetical protein